MGSEEEKGEAAGSTVARKGCLSFSHVNFCYVLFLNFFSSPLSSFPYVLYIAFKQY
jgi:hypothetical protein